jgi:ketosteroid isomerase-like protein
MNIRFAAALLLAAIFTGHVSSFAAEPAPRDAPSDVAAFEERLARALDQRDRATLETLIADPFTWVHASDGRVDTREVWLANAAKGMALTGQRTVRTEHGASIEFYGEPAPHTAVRISRVSLVDAPNHRESWLRQTHLLVRGADGAWRLALGQGVLMYEGPPIDLALHQRYVGTYVISPDRKLVLSWEEGALFATLPSGAKSQIFLASPTEEATRTTGGARLKFTLGADGRPASVALVRGDQEVWRANRAAP